MQSDERMTNILKWNIEPYRRQAGFGEVEKIRRDAGRVTVAANYLETLKGAKAAKILGDIGTKRADLGDATFARNIQAVLLSTPQWLIADDGAPATPAMTAARRIDDALRRRSAEVKAQMAPL